MNGDMVQRVRRWSVLAGATLAIMALGVGVVPGTAAAAGAGGRKFENGIADIESRSTYSPCSMITWSYDASAQPRSGASMVVDVRAALGMLSRGTGVTFQEVPFGASVDLVFDWSPLADYEPGTQAAA